MQTLHSSPSFPFGMAVSAHVALSNLAIKAFDFGAFDEFLTNPTILVR
jgi:hypothetical protein